jgi:hypothetical protein
VRARAHALDGSCAPDTVRCRRCLTSFTHSGRRSRPRCRPSTRQYLPASSRWVHPLSGYGHGRRHGRQYKLQCSPLVASAAGNATLVGAPLSVPREHSVGCCGEMGLPRLHAAGDVFPVLVCAEHGECGRQRGEGCDKGGQQGRLHRGQGNEEHQGSPLREQPCARLRDPLNGS